MPIFWASACFFCVVRSHYGLKFRGLPGVLTKCIFMLRAAFVHKYKLLLAGGLLLGSLASPVLVHARQSTSADAAAVIAVAELPAQGRQTLQLIRDGGPFPYEKDGTVFGNRERLLPAKQRLLPGIHGENGGFAKSGSATHRVWRSTAHTGCLLLHRRPLRQFPADCRMRVLSSEKSGPQSRNQFY